MASTRQKGGNHDFTGGNKCFGKGRGKAHKKIHEYGCRHYRVMDLKDMSTLRDFYHYNSKDCWLVGKRCLGPGNNVTCTIQMNKEDMEPEKGSNIRLYYCDMGIRAANYMQQRTEEERKLYNDHKCNMVLCHQCRNVRQKTDMKDSVEVETIGRTTTRTRSIRKNQL